jgi:hypothetical protein
MADMSAENARPGSTTASAMNSKDTSRAATPSNAAAEKVPEDGSKFKTLLGILRKYVFSQQPHVCVVLRQMSKQGANTLVLQVHRRF